MPPSRSLGLPVEEWGETDALLTQAYIALDDLRCRCGCGQWADEAHDPDTEGRWHISADDTCYAGAAIEEHRKTNSSPQPGALLSIRLVPEGEAAGFDPARVAAELAARDERLAAMTTD